MYIFQSLKEKIMAKKRLLLGLMAVTVVLLFLGGCASAPIQPAVSQTVIGISRHSSVSGVGIVGSMDIYIDGRIAQTLGKKPKNITLKTGEMAYIPVNNGVHTIYVKFSTIQSETINFTASGGTLSFVATLEGVIPTRKLVLSRSTVEDDTGSMTRREVQSAY
jgi:hypothetical protein